MATAIQNIPDIRARREAVVRTSSAFGIDSLSASGSGGIVATDPADNLIIPTASANPGESITIWGSGLGADTANDDRTYPQKQNNLNNAQVYVGGILASVSYAGRSQYPGVDQINVTVPSLGALPTSLRSSNSVDAFSGFQGGCGVSVVVLANSVASNFGTLPVSAGGGVCSDVNLGITGTELLQLSGESTARIGGVGVSQITQPAPQSQQTFTTIYGVTASFNAETGEQFVRSVPSIGSCIVTWTSLRSPSPMSTGLDAGTPILFTGAGLSLQVPEGQTTGLYDASSSTAPVAGTTYTLSGPGGKDVGPFTVSLTYPEPLTWTNESSISTITRSQGQLITWSGSGPGDYVVIIGGPFNNLETELSTGFACVASGNDEQFTIPPYVLLALPGGKGNLLVNELGGRVRFTATGLDYAYASAGITWLEDVVYQ